MRQVFEMARSSASPASSRLRTHKMSATPLPPRPGPVYAGNRLPVSRAGTFSRQALRTGLCEGNFRNRRAGEKLFARGIECGNLPDRERIFSKTRMTKQKILDLYFLEARHKLSNSPPSSTAWNARMARKISALKFSRRARQAKIEKSSNGSFARIQRSDD